MSVKPMTDDDFKKIMAGLGMPESLSLLQALKQVENHATQAALSRSAPVQVSLASQSVPEGWKLVPVEPTPEMLESIANTVPCMTSDARLAYPAMLAAAPSASAAPAVDAERISGWIPVRERRPGVGVVVLGFWKNSAGPHSHITGQNYGITARNEHGLWYDASEDDNEDDEWMRPDYWQPLPPPAAIANQEAQDGR